MNSLYSFFAKETVLMAKTIDAASFHFTFESLTTLTQNLFLPLNMSCDLTLRMRDIIVVCIAFVSGFYLGYLNASSFCDPMVDLSAQRPIPIISDVSQSPMQPLVTSTDHQENVPFQEVPSTDRGLFPNNSGSTGLIKSNHYDTTYQWQYFKNDRPFEIEII